MVFRTPMVFREQGRQVEHPRGCRCSDNAPPNGTRHKPSSALAARGVKPGDGIQASVSAGFGVDARGKGGSWTNRVI